MNIAFPRQSTVARASLYCALLFGLLYGLVAIFPDAGFLLVRRVQIVSVQHGEDYEFLGRLDETYLNSEAHWPRPLLLERENAPVISYLHLLKSILGRTRVYYFLDHYLQAEDPNWAAHRWRVLGPGESTDIEIRQAGSGRYAIRDGYLHFSTSDNSDPGRNGRAYALAIPFINLEATKLTLLGLAILFVVVFLASNRTTVMRWRDSKVFVGGWAVCGTLVVYFLAVEVFLRVMIPFTETVYPTRLSPTAGSLFLPNALVSYTDHTDYWTQQKSNSLGFLDREPRIPKTPGTFRILVLGNSYVEGYMLPIDEKFWILLQRMMIRAFPNRKLDTVAMGRAGCGQECQLSFYETYGELLQPDLVIELITPHDITYNSPLLMAVQNGWDPYHEPQLNYEVNDDDTTFRRIDIDLNWSQHVLPLPAVTDRSAMLAARLKYLTAIPNFSPKLAGWKLPNDVDIDAMYAVRYDNMPLVFKQALLLTDFAFERIKKFADRDHFRFLAVTTEDMDGAGVGTPGGRNTLFGRELDGGTLLRQLKRMLAAKDFPLLDLYPRFAAPGDINQSHYRHDLHWNSTGHQWAAEAIFDYLQQHQELMQWSAATQYVGR
jgi:hypothetical protein